MQNLPSTPTFSYQNATGKIPYGFTNDYMFRAILQQNRKVLKGLICSLLHLQPDDVSSVEIRNPIKLGQNIEDKEFILDINVILNNNTLLNLEMQVANGLDWPDRSLEYLCRLYDQLSHGESYNFTKPAIHIGFLDFTPFPQYPEFYATYKLLNVKNHHLYSDKFILCVVDLKQIDLATTEDKAYKIDYWARLFKATTWEEIKMIAENNEYLSEASQTLYEMNADEMIQEQCYARRRRIRHENFLNDTISGLTQALQEQNTKFTAAISEKDAEIARLKALLAEKECQD